MNVALEVSVVNCRRLMITRKYRMCLMFRN